LPLLLLLKLLELLVLLLKLLLHLLLPVGSGQLLLLLEGSRRCRRCCCRGSPTRRRRQRHPRGRACGNGRRGRRLLEVHQVRQRALRLLEEQNVNALALSVRLGLNGEEDNARELVGDAGPKVASDLVANDLKRKRKKKMMKCMSVIAL
jgi:hypothetical protein